MQVSSVNISATVGKFEESCLAYPLSVVDPEWFK